MEGGEPHGGYHKFNKPCSCSHQPGNGDTALQGFEKKIGYTERWRQSRRPSGFFLIKLYLSCTDYARNYFSDFNRSFGNRCCGI